MNYKAIAFDLFGTLVRRAYKSGCYRDLFWRLEIDPEVGSQLAMMKNIGLYHLAKDMVPGHGLDLTDLVRELHRDLAGITLFDDTIEALRSLRNRGLKLAVISNLAQPYGEPTLKLLESSLGFSFDAVALSYEIGTLKPHSHIFNTVALQLNLLPEEILVVGNSRQDDCMGAEAAGMANLYLDRKGWSGYGARTINTLLQVTQYFDQTSDDSMCGQCGATPLYLEERPLLIFLDTEFTSIDVRRPRLISIGLAAEDSRTFYAELSDTWERHHCSQFVKKHVLPLLEGESALMSAQGAQQRLIAWIETFQQKVRIVSDAPDYDWKLMLKLFDIYRPANLHHGPAYFNAGHFNDVADELEQVRVQALEGLPNHHALRDALQLKAACDLLHRKRHPNFEKLYCDYYVEEN